MKTNNKTLERLKWFNDHKAVLEAYLEGSEIQWNDEGYMWITCTMEPEWDYRTQYRIKPKTPLQIPWDLIGKEYQWAAKDKDGRVFVFTQKPYIKCEKWMRCTSGEYQLLPLVNIDPDGIPWDKSLVQRPTK